MYRNSFRMALRVGCLILVLALVVPTVHAQENGFVETFDDPSLPGWEHSEGVRVEDGVLRIEPGSFAFRGGAWGNMTFTTRIRRFGEGELVITFRAGDAKGYHLLLAANSLALQREEAGEVIELIAGELPIPPEEWVEVHVEVEGSDYAIIVNGELLLVVSDPEPLAPGGVGFEALGDLVAEIDEIAVQVSGTSPPSGEQPSDEGDSEEAAALPPGGSAAYESLPWVRTGGPIGGLGYDIRYNFDDHNLWYVTDAWAGIHLSTDRGLTWFPSNEGVDVVFGPSGDSIPVFSVTVDPHDPNTVWIGTQNDGSIFKSTDRGYTWNRMDNGIDKELMPLSFRGITVDPNNPNIVYIMGEIGSIAWTPDHTLRLGLELDLTMGIVYKSTDGGQNWIEIWRGDNLARYMWIDPRDSNVLYVSTGIFDRESATTDVAAGVAGGVGILKSTDGGQTWRVLDEENGLLDLYVGSLFMHPENPDMLLAAASENNWSYYDGRSTAGIYLTEDGGEVWTRVVSAESSGGSGFGELFAVVEYCPSNPDIAYAASEQAVYRSEDVGLTWQRFDKGDGTWGPPGVIAGFPIDMQCDPDDPMRIFVNNYLGGNFLSEDGGETWVSASQGYTGALVHHLAVAPGRPATVFAGSRTGVFRSDNGGAEWVGLTNPPVAVPMRMNEITAIAVSPADENIVLSAPNDAATALYSSDGGDTWHHAPLGTGSPNTLAFASSDPTIVYAAVGPENCGDDGPQAVIGMMGCEESGLGVYVSADSGLTWDVPDGNQALGESVTELAVHPHDVNTLFAFMPLQGVMKSTDGGATWVLTSNGLPSLTVLTLVIDPTNPDVIFAGLEGGAIYKTTNGGNSWAQSAAGLDPNATVHGIAIDPTNGQIVYATSTFSGVHLSTDGGATWQTINAGLDHRTAVALAISDDGAVLYVSIEGAGVYRLGTPMDVSQDGDPQGAPAEVSQEPSLAEREEKSGSGLCPGSLVPLGLVLAGFAVTRRKTCRT